MVAKLMEGRGLVVAKHGPNMDLASRSHARGMRLKQQQDTLPEWSKGVDSSSTSENCVGSNPTGVIYHLSCRRCF